MRVTFDTLKYEVSDHVASLQLNRPEVINAFNGRMEAELRDAWQTIRADDDVRVVVLSGAGTRGFCSGWDRKSQGEDRLEKARTANVWAARDVGEQIGPKSNSCWKPVIAAVHGIACGGAFYLLGESDIIISTDDAEFFDPHTTFGLTPVFEPALLRLRLPYSEIMRINLMGNDERLSARRAYQLGLVSDLVAPENLLTEAMRLATIIAAKPPSAVQGSVYAMWNTQNMSHNEIQAVGSALCALGNNAAKDEQKVEGFGDGKTWSYRVRG
jgi:enoyl-CoA hydratase/carnithine racemase